MAPSSSAKKVAKLASRGKGKKVRFQSGTTFPVIVFGVFAAMIALIVYAKVTTPGESEGTPQPEDAWSIAYGIRVCDEWLPSLTGTAAELDKDASTGDLTAVQNGSDADGIIHYHAQVGGNTGRKARLGVFLDVYDVKLSNTKLELPESQVGPGEARVFDTEEGDVFKGTSCEGDTPQLRVRVWDDYTKDDFSDKVTAFRDLRFTNNGMVFAIAIVPEGDDIPKPPSAPTLADLGVIGSGTVTSTTVTGETSTTVTADTTATTDTTDAATTTTGG